MLKKLEINYYIDDTNFHKFGDNKYQEIYEKSKSYYEISLEVDNIYNYSLKDRLEVLLFDNLKEIYIINSLSDKNIRYIRKEELVGNVKYLIYLFISINKLNILSDKQYKILYISIEEIYKCLIGWLKSDK